MVKKDYSWQGILNKQNFSIRQSLEPLESLQRFAFRSDTNPELTQPSQEDRVTWVKPERPRVGLPLGGKQAQLNF